jgi:squalene cyclase
MKLKYDPLPFVLETGKPYHKVQILHALGKKDQLYEEILATLRAQQNPDGGWSWDYKENQPSAVAISARTLYVILDTGDCDREPVEKGVKFLLSMQRQDGGWSENPVLQPQIGDKWAWFSAVHSVTWITGRVISTLIRAGYPLDDRIEKGLLFLEGMQNEEGGWPSHTGSPPETKMWNMEEVVSAFVATGRRDTDTVKRALEATRAHKDHWPEPVESPLYMFQQLGYTVGHRYVRECIDYFIENQHEDGGWGYYNESPSDPTQTASWTGVLLHYGVKMP